MRPDAGCPDVVRAIGRMPRCPGSPDGACPALCPASPDARPWPGYNLISGWPDVPRCRSPSRQHPGKLDAQMYFAWPCPSGFVSGLPGCKALAQMLGGPDVPRYRARFEKKRCGQPPGYPDARMPRCPDAQMPGCVPNGDEPWSRPPAGRHHSTVAPSGASSSWFSWCSCAPSSRPTPSCRKVSGRILKVLKLDPSPTTTNPPSNH